MNLYHKDQAFGAFQDAFDYVCSYSKDNRGKFKKYILNKCLLIGIYIHVVIIDQVVMQK